MTVPKLAARPAATVMLIRDADGGLEVLMVRRRARGFFGGLTVFPGGAVDPIDSSELTASVVVGRPRDAAYRAAALRELAEETGLALTPVGVSPAPPGRGAGLLSELEASGIRLDGTRLTLVSRWVTPEAAPTRFDTLFYLVGVTDTPEIRIDADELVGHMWVGPSAALDMHSTGEVEMFLPTVSHLRWLAWRSDIEDAIAAAQGADDRALVQPRRMGDGSLVPIHLPDH